MGQNPGKSGSGGPTVCKQLVPRTTYGYRLPNGLVVYRINGQIGTHELDSEGEPIPMKVSFIDNYPIRMDEAINYDHLADVVIFAVAEIAKRQFDAQEAKYRGAQILADRETMGDDLDYEIEDEVWKNTESIDLSDVPMAPEDGLVPLTEDEQLEQAAAIAAAISNLE
jgi:hypothetical protein